MKAILLLSVLFNLVPHAAYLQIKGDAKVNEVENMFEYLSLKRVQRCDTITYFRLADSIKKEATLAHNKWKKDYATLYYYHFRSSCYLTSDSLLAYYKSLNGWIASINNPAIKALYKFTIGDVLFGSKNYTSGLNLMLEALSECEQLGYEHVPRISYMLYNMSNHYYNFGNYRKSIDLANIAAKYSSKFPGSGGLNTWGMGYQKLGLYDSAAIKFKQAIAKASNEKHFVWISIASGNLGRTYCLQGKYKQGIPLLYFDAITNQYEEPVNSATSSLYLVDAFMKMNNMDSAWLYLHLSKKIFLNRWTWNTSDLARSNFGSYYYQQFSRLLERDGRYKDALQSLDSANVLKEEYRSTFDWPLLNSAEKRIQGLEYQQNLALLEAKRRNEKLRSVFFYITLTALLIIAGLIISLQTIKYKKGRQLMMEKEKNMTLRQMQADKELVNAREKLDEYLKNIAEKNNLIEKITTDIERFAQQIEPTKETSQLSEAVHQLTNASLLTNDEWREFQVRFDKVYNGFIAQLSVTVPGITPAEQRLLALSKLKMSSKEMGMMLGISPASVRTAKYRLRKKLMQNNQSGLEELLDMV